MYPNWGFWFANITSGNPGVHPGGVVHICMYIEVYRAPSELDFIGREIESCRGMCT
jgi:hypothetical protein